MELKRINLHRISEILSEKELKDVLGGSGGGNHSLKCFNTTTSCWVDSCPQTIAEAKARCSESDCGGNYGDLISCA